ncbi:MAG: EI24 domain-containing protein [Alteraurantiacibacter sp.]
MSSVFTCLLLSLRQLGEPAVLRVLLKSLGVSLLLFAALALAGWWGLDALLERAGLAEDLRGLASLVLTLLGLWLCWRLIAMLVIQFYAEDVVRAVEARHYPQAASAARDLPWNEALRVSLSNAGRALLFNLIALPFALLLLVTGIGPALLFWLLNAVLIGRELADMVWLRHAHAHPGLSPVSKWERLALGGVIAALFAVPFAALLAPVLGAAAAAHLVHRKTAA